PAGRYLFADPRDDLVEHVLERSGGFETEDVARLADVGHTHLDVVLVGRVGDQPQRFVTSVDLPPDDLGELAHRRRAGGGQVEVLVHRLVGLHGEPDPAGKVAAVGVVAHLGTVAEYVQGVLAFQDLLHEVGHDVTHRQLDVAAAD